MAVFTSIRPARIPQMRDFALLLIIGFLVIYHGLPALAALAQEGGNAAPPAAALATTFTYQGRITQDGVPKDGALNLQFRLWDAAAAGTMVGSIGPNAVTVTNGLFAAQLDFGANAFTGEKRWIETVANGTPLGRIELTATPYALYANKAGQVDWTNITNKPSDVGLTLPYSGTTANGLGSAFFVRNTGSGPFAFGIRGDSDHNFGVAGIGGANAFAGVYGTSGQNGVYGLATTGAGIFATSGSGPGVRASSTSGDGITSETSSASKAGLFAWNHAAGLGVLGLADDGQAAVDDGIGVYGSSGGKDDSPPKNVGVYGTAFGTDRVGVWGESTGPGTIGVRGVGASRGLEGISVSGDGVYGYSTNGSGVRGAGNTGAGVFGTSISSSGVSGSGSAGYGVFGTSTGNDGVVGTVNLSNRSGVYGWNGGSGPGITGYSVGGFAIQALGNTKQGALDRGMVKAAALIVNTSNGQFGAPAFSRCFNSQASGATVSSAPCGFTIAKLNWGYYRIDFGFDVSSSFFSLTGLLSGNQFLFIRAVGNTYVDVGVTTDRDCADLDPCFTVVPDTNFFIEVH